MKNIIGQITFIGAGPGDPDLITIKGAKALAEADLIIYAGSLVPKALLCHCKPDAEIYDSSGLTLEQTNELIISRARSGKNVARLHSGDPSLYGAVPEQAALLEHAGSSS